MGNLVKCKACNEVISNKAKSCPKCGEPQKRHSRLAVAFLIMMLISLAVGISNFDEQESKRIAKDAATPALSISAKELYDAYEANEVAADQKYKGVRAVVDGRIQDISTILGTPQVSIESKWGGVPILCQLDKANINQLIDLKVGQMVKVKGRIVGKTIAIGIRDCIIIK